MSVLSLKNFPVCFLFLILNCFALSSHISANTYPLSEQWYAKLENQNVVIPLSDLEDEILVADKTLDMGFSLMAQYRPSLFRPVKIAILDHGIDVKHPLLKNHLSKKLSECDIKGDPPLFEKAPDNDGNGKKGDCLGWDFSEDKNLVDDDEGHGTHVAGIIKTLLLSNVPFEILPLKVLKNGDNLTRATQGRTLAQRMKEAIDYALAEKVDIIHMSLGWPRLLHTSELQKSLQTATDQNVFLVAAAGNSSQEFASFPCLIKAVICVGSVRPNGELSPFSNRGSYVDVFGFVEKILSTHPLYLPPQDSQISGFDHRNGTSQAAPMVTAALAALRSYFPEENTIQILARLYGSAHPSLSGRQGLINLKKALTFDRPYILYQSEKNTHIRPDRNGQYLFDLRLQNSLRAISQLKLNFKCPSALIAWEDNQEFLDSFESLGRKIDLPRLTEEETLSCHLQMNYTDINQKKHSQLFTIKLHLLSSPTPKTVTTYTQTQTYVGESRNGAFSRFVTLDALGDSPIEPFYQVRLAEKIFIFKWGELIGEIQTPKNCKHLRIWQLSLGLKKQNQFLAERRCSVEGNEKNDYLEMDYLSSKDLTSIWGPIKFRPQLTVLNYEQSQIHLNHQAPPTFRFMNSGFLPENPNPWESVPNGQVLGLYELKPEKTETGWELKTYSLDQPQEWSKKLGLRFIGNLRPLHLMGDRYLVLLQNRTAWVDLRAQTVKWANLEKYILTGSRAYRVKGSKQTILNNLLTPFDFRGYLVDELITLSFHQEDNKDPIMDVLAVSLELGFYKVHLQTFKNVIQLKFSSDGRLIAKNISPIPRFDFLKTAEVLSTVQHVKAAQETDHVVIDASRIHETFFTVIHAEQTQRYFVPTNCVTQAPLSYEGKNILPFFCVKDRQTFTVELFELPVL
jgi:hypothetical protein